MKEKQQQLLFEKGITNVPSDALCSDNALEESVGMIYDNGEHRVIQHPEEFITSKTNTGIQIDRIPTLIYVHSLNGNKRYIGYATITIGQNTFSLGLCWGTVSNKIFSAQGYFEVNGSPLQYTSETHITSIGKTLIISDANGMHYFNWKGNTYNKIIYPVPDIKLEAKLVDTGTSGAYGLFVSNSASADGMIKVHATASTTPGGRPTFRAEVYGGKHEDYNNLVTGLYSKNLKEVSQSKCFSKPFFVRAALEMYDGTYTQITSPILLFPSITESTKFFLYCKPDEMVSPFPVRGIICTTQMLKLYIRQTTDYSEYSDLIKDVVIFASRGVEIYSTSQDQPSTVEDDNTIGNNISSLQAYVEGQLGASDHRTDTFAPPEVEGFAFVTRIRGLKNREAEAIKNEIESTSVFYKIASIGLQSINGFVDIASKTTSEVIENLEVQETLTDDDYFSRCALVPNYLYSYNARLNLANVSRGFYEGSGFFLPLDQNTSPYYVFDVTIKKEDGDTVTVRHREQTTQKQGIYFYYPDSRATHVTIYKEGSQNKIILDANLKEHPFLNGAYYFAGMSTSTDEPTGSNISNIPSYTSPSPEALPNYIIQSEVNNPFVFKAAGYFRVGTGKIKGMSTITQALSEGQFGQYPLLVFSESGIWGLSVASTGYYSSIHPMSREVCNNADSITQTDGAVFFTSDKGLMVVVGSQVKCVSEQLSGKMVLTSSLMPSSYSLGLFLGFLKTCHIAYDYRDSLLWLFSGSAGANCCYIYSMKSGTFGKCEFATFIKPVNNYPDYLIQKPNGTVYSLIERLDINATSELTNNTYGAHLLTRPMKLENALALKSIMQIKHIYQFTPYQVTVTNNGQQTTETRRASIELRIYASNNLDGTWEQLLSLRGKPWKYYRFRYDFNGLKAIDRFSGTMLITQERRTDKLR